MLYYPGAGFAAKANQKLEIAGHSMPFAALLLSVGLVVWASFWFMDRHWYHRLLLGAVRQGMKIEEKLETVLPEITLTESIKKESPTSFLGRTIRSHHRLDMFYGVVGAILGLAIIALTIPSKLTFSLICIGILFFIYLVFFTSPSEK